MKLVTSKKLPPCKIGRYLFHANPDRLQDETISAQGFSEILSDIVISGTWKLTRGGRLIETQNKIIRFLDNKVKYRILDIGASDGSTTCDLVSEITEKKGKAVDAIIADRFLFLDIYENKYVREYRTTDGTPILAKFGKFALRLPRSEHKLAILTNMLIRLYLMSGFIRKGLIFKGKINLLSPVVRSCSSIQAREVDVMEVNRENTGSFDVIRASNVLLTINFNNDQLAHIINNIFSMLNQEGLLVISRNQIENGQETERGSIWQKKGNTLSLLDEFGGGSEIGHLVNSIYQS